MTIISLVVAAARNGVIGRDGRMPWHISSELKRFKALTMGKPVIMGRRTWDSLPKRPLPGRRNIVVTRARDFDATEAERAASMAEALALAGEMPEVMVIGGGQIYEAALPLATRIYLTEVDLSPEGDTVFPTPDPQAWREVSATAHPAEAGDSAGYVIRVLERRPK